jgi:hypothetical protein
MSDNKYYVKYAENKLKKARVPTPDLDHRFDRDES